MDSTLTRKDFLWHSMVSAASLLFAGPLLSTAAMAYNAERSKAAAGRFGGSHENLTYNNPFGQKVKTAWYDGKLVRHLSLGATTQRPPYKIAEQYNIILKDQYHGPTGTVEKFEKQEEATIGCAIFDSAPGDPNYSPIWHINWVIAPHTYKPNTITDAKAVRKSGYKIISADIWEI